MESIEHQLYINYLYSEFHFKLNNTDKWKGYLAKAKYLSSKVNPYIVYHLGMNIKI